MKINKILLDLISYLFRILSFIPFTSSKKNFVVVVTVTVVDDDDGDDGDSDGDVVSFFSKCYVIE